MQNYMGLKTYLRRLSPVSTEKPNSNSRSFAMHRSYLPKAAALRASTYPSPSESTPAPSA